MWLLALFLLCACNQGFASECIDGTLRCTHRRVPFPTRKDLPETRGTLNRVCRDQNEYYDCLQNIQSENNEGDIPPSTDKLNRLDAEYMLSELCTEGLKTRNSYLKHAVCINKQKTDVCTSPEFLIILLANEKAPTRCSIQNKVVSCVSMMLTMNCGAEAGFLYRRLIHIANDGDVHCNSGEDLGEVFSLFVSSEENKNTEGDQFDSRTGIFVEDSSDELFFHRLGEIAEGVESEITLKSDSSSNVVQDYEHASEKPVEVDNSTFLNDGWNGMEFLKDWVSQTIYGKEQPLPANPNTEEPQDVSHPEGVGLGQRMCSPFEVNSERQAVVDEQCFDEMLEDIVETEGNVHKSENIYMKLDDEMEVSETSSISELYTDPSTHSENLSFQMETSTPDGISLDQDPLTTTQVEFSEHEASRDSLTNDNLVLKTIDEPNTLKYNEHFVNEQDMEMDLENEKLHSAVDEETLALDVEYSTVGSIDKPGSIDSIARHTYTITDIFDHGSSPDASKVFEDTYLVDERNIVSESERDHEDVTISYFENEFLAKQHEEHDALKEITKRIGEIEVEFPVLESQNGTNETVESMEILSDISEFSQYSAGPESNKFEFHSNFQETVEDSIKNEGSSDEFSDESFRALNPDKEMRGYLKTETENDTKDLIFDSSEVYKNPQIEHGRIASVSMELINTQDQGSGSWKIDEVQDIEDLKQTSNSKLQYADFSTDVESILELAEDLETLDAETDEISSEVTYLNENGSESSSSESNYTLDLNSYKLSSDLQEERDQYVAVQEYATSFEEEDALKDAESSQDLKMSSEDEYFSSTKIENFEGLNFDDLPVVGINQEYSSETDELVDDPFKNLYLTDVKDEYSLSGDNNFPESTLDDLTLTPGALEDAENYELQKTESSADRMVESLEEIKPDFTQNEVKNFDYSQPIIIKLSDEDVRKYYEQRHHELQNFKLPSDSEGSKLDSSEMYYLNEDTSKFQMQDASKINLPKEDWEYEEVILEPVEIDSEVTDHEPVEDVPVKSEIYSYESVRIPSRRSLNIDNTELTHLSEDGNTEEKVFNPQNMHENYETSATIPTSASESLKFDNDASNVFYLEDLVNRDQYSVSDDTTLEEGDNLLSTQEDSEAQNTEGVHSDFSESVGNPEDIIMHHLDRLLQDATASSSEESIIEESITDEVDQEEIELKTRESIDNVPDQGSLVAQLIEEQSKCHMNECEQPVSTQLSEISDQEHDTYRIETNKIKILTPQDSDKLLREKLRSNKAYLSRDPVHAFVSENDSKVFIRDVEHVKVPCLQLFNAPDNKYIECYIDSREPTYVYLPNFSASD